MTEITRFHTLNCFKLPNFNEYCFRALKEDFEKEDVLGKLFWKARAKARVVLKEQLAEFRDKRAAGLGSIFGPNDSELKQCIDNRTRELGVIDELLLPLLESSS